MQQEADVHYDPSRRQSLGAESLQEYDITDRNSLFEADNLETLYLLNTHAHLEFDYADDIFNLNRTREIIFHARNCCMDDQPEVRPHSRIY